MFKKNRFYKGKTATGEHIYFQAHNFDESKVHALICGGGSMEVNISYITEYQDLTGLIQDGLTRQKLSKETRRNKNFLLRNFFPILCTILGLIIISLLIYYA